MTSSRELMFALDENKQTSEPAVTVGTTTGTVAGLLAVVLYFFPDIPNGVIQALLVLVAFALPIISALFTRGKVWSPASVQAVVDEAVNRALEAAKKKSTLGALPAEKLRLSTPMSEEEAAQYREDLGGK
jgi:hypothetical protein